MLGALLRVSPRGNIRKSCHRWRRPSVIGGNLHFALRFCAAEGTASLQFSVRQLDTAGLQSVAPDIAAGLAWRAWAGHLLGAQDRDLFQSLVSDLAECGFYFLAGVLDQFRMGSRIRPLARQNCSMTAADSRPARVTMW
jgi:hypothetical protein